MRAIEQSSQFKRDLKREAKGPHRAALAKEGHVVVDRFGCPKESPWCGIEHKAQNRFRILCRELGLDVQQRMGLACHEMSLMGRDADAAAS